VSIWAKLALSAALLVAAAAGVWKFWHSAEKSGYERRQREDEAAAEFQREANRGRARAAEQGEAKQAQVRTVYITKTIERVRNVTVPLASCPVPDAAVRMLNDAARCARQGRSPACAPDDAVPGS
jgi:hypothetical protein